MRKEVVSEIEVRQDVELDDPHVHRANRNHHHHACHVRPNRRSHMEASGAEADITVDAHWTIDSTLGVSLAPTTASHFATVVGAALFLVRKLLV